MSTTAAEKLVQGRNSKEYQSLVCPKEDDLVPPLMPYFLRILAGMLTVLLLVTVAVSVITTYDKNYNAFSHMHGCSPKRPNQ